MFVSSLQAKFSEYLVLSMMDNMGEYVFHLNLTILQKNLRLFWFKFWVFLLIYFGIFKFWGYGNLGLTLILRLSS